MPAIAEKPPEERTWDYFQARRFVLPDFDQYGLWILSRLKEIRGQHLPEERRMLGWLKGLTSSNEHLFITNDKAVLLAEAAHIQMQPAPRIQEVFCFCQEGALKYGASLYDDMMRWAKSLSASEIICGRATDVPQPMIEDVLGTKLQHRRVLFAKLD